MDLGSELCGPQTLGDRRALAKPGRRSGGPGVDFGVRRPSPRALPAGLSALLLSLPAAAQGPFQPGLRWTRSADSADPWIPRAIAFGADLNEVWMAAPSGNRHVELLPLPGRGAQPALQRDDSWATSIGAFGVCAGSDTGAFFSLGQFPAPDSLHRSTLCGRRDPAAVQGSGAQAWSHDAGFLTNGAARIACDASGSRVALAVWDSATHEVQLDLLDGQGGLLLQSVRLPALALNELALSADGTRVALASGLDLWILDEQLATRQHEVLATSTGALALSGDGALCALGGSGELRLFEALPSGAYGLRWSLPAAAGELAARAALSRDGRSLALGWWNAQNGTAVRLQLCDTAAAALLWEKYQPGTAGGLQNLPAALAASDDGERAAFGLWGDGTNEPELLLVARTGALVLSADLPGSVQGLALDAHGQRLAVAHKEVHANQPGALGSVRLYDTGERDLVLRSRAAIGATLELSAERAGSGTVFFLEAPRSPFPQFLRGAQGALWLQRNALTVRARTAGPDGRADLSLPIPADPLLIGSERHFQAAWRTGGVLHFGATVLDALVL